MGSVVGWGGSLGGEALGPGRSLGGVVCGIRIVTRTVWEAEKE